MNAKSKLDQLAEFQFQKDALELQRQAIIDTIYTPEIRAQVEAVNLEFAQKVNAVEENIEALTAEIKAAVLAGGGSVKGTHLMAVYTKGRVTWDSKLLEGMMMIVPALEKARKEGEPSITIRRM